MVVGWAEMGSLPKPHYDKTYGKEKHQLVQDEICENNAVRQSSCANKELWRAELLCIKFLIQSVYDDLSSLANLHSWGVADTPACQLCRGAP